MDGGEGLRGGRCEEDEIAEAGEERKTLECVGSAGGDDIFYLMLITSQTFRVQNAVCCSGSPPAISLSASPRLTRGEVDHERVREIGQKKKKSLGSTPCPYLCSQRVMEGKQLLNRFGGGGEDGQSNCTNTTLWF